MERLANRQSIASPYGLPVCAPVVDRTGVASIAAASPTAADPPYYTWRLGAPGTGPTLQGADEPLLPACSCLAAHLLWEMQQPMTQTAHVPAREPVSQFLCEAARLGLELRRETLLSRAALLYKRFCDSLIPWLKIKESHRIPYRPGHRRHPMRRASRGPLSGARFHRPMPDRFRTRLACARRLHLARARCGVRTCADPGCSTPALEGRHRMTDPRRTWEKAFLANRT